MNSDKLSEIRELLGDEFPTLLDVYTNDTFSRLKDIEIALTEGDLNTIRDVAHAMKSSSANIGADEVSKLGARIEEFSKQGDKDDISKLIPRFKKAIDDAIQIMNN